MRNDTKRASPSDPSKSLEISLLDLFFHSSSPPPLRLIMPVAVAHPPSIPPVLKQQRELTSGQHEPVEELLQPYAAFPKQVTGPTVWTREELVGEKGEARWKYHWTPELVKELEESYETWKAKGETLPSISKVSSSLYLVLSCRNHDLLSLRARKS